MDMYDYGYLGETRSTSSLAGSLVWTIIAVVLAVIGGIALYFTVFSKNNEKKYTGFMAKLYEWFQFKYFVIDDLFRIGYIVSALALTLLSFNLISTSFLSFILVLVLGNIGLRVSFELLMLFTEMCYNIKKNHYIMVFFIEFLQQYLK